ncbi:hypothetical protein [Gallibacterium anatis]|uniref:hypothetical protein n=1 Tax=Gallibacterium anatis TaxID=750 RepID=UPI000531428E|nr:hypothetical protein [Gallibacterium anatis]KGQ44921.1 hypothetical protein JP29_07795 [Gallibacterium anatis]
MADFTRQLGNEPGVQLGPTVDNSGGLAYDAVEEQTIAGVMRLTRGPIDRAFEVYKANFYRVVGMPESIKKNPLNIAQSLLMEATQKGAKRVLVSRLVGSDAKVKWVVVKKSESKDAVEVERFKLDIKVADEKPTENFLFAIKHLGCFNDGIKIAVSAKAVYEDDGETEKDATDITLRIMDRNGTELDSFTGSIDSDSVDADGYPNDLASIIENFSSEDYEMVIAADAVIAKDTMAYGKNASGIQREFVSDVLNAFEEGSTSFTTQNYNEAVERLRQASVRFIQLSSFGSENTSLCAALAQLAFDRDITVAIDINGTFKPKQAIAWIKQLGLKGHLISVLWHPVECRDPAGVSGRIVMPTSALRCSLAAARNAQLNAFGLAPKQYPIAGANYPIQRQGMKVLYNPNDEELSDLAAAGITPVIYSDGAFIFNDVISLLGKNTSALNLLPAVEIVTSIERYIARMAKQYLLFLPMQEAIKTTIEVGTAYLESCVKSGWLTVSETLPTGFEIGAVANKMRPLDVMNIKVRMHPEGCVRQVIITPEVTK